MQVIYLDTLICVNLFIDYVILSAVKKILHIRGRLLRVLLGATFAGVSTVAVFLPFYTQFVSIMYKLIVSAITVLISFGYQGIRKLITRTLTFTGISILLCGSVLAIELIWNPSRTMVYNDVLYFDISPSFLITVTLAVYFILYIYKTITEKHKLSCAIHSVMISIGNTEKLSFESAVDTGCNLKEPFSGLPVIIVEEELLYNISIPDNKKRIIPLSTISGTDTMTGFRPDKVYIDNNEVTKGCYIGICKNKLQGEIKSIMGEELSEAVI